MLGMVVGMEIAVVTITNARDDGRGRGRGRWMTVEDGHRRWTMGLTRWSASSPMLGLAGVVVGDS